MTTEQLQAELVQANIARESLVVYIAEQAKRDYALQDKIYLLEMENERLRKIVESVWDGRMASFGVGGAA